MTGMTWCGMTRYQRTARNMLQLPLPLGWVYTVMWCTLLYSTLLYSTLLYSTLLYSTLLYCNNRCPCIIISIFSNFILIPLLQVPLSAFPSLHFHITIVYHSLSNYLSFLLGIRNRLPPGIFFFKSRWFNIRTVRTYVGPFRARTHEKVRKEGCVVCATVLHLCLYLLASSSYLFFKYLRIRLCFAVVCCGLLCCTVLSVC